jgi:cell wall-associated NlpC family hydrolase
MRFRIHIAFFLFLINSLILSAQDSTLSTVPALDSLSISEKPAFAADSLLAIAETFKGTPYRLGGHTKSGFDCSGFVHYLYEKFDVPLAYSCTGIAGLCRKIPKSELQKGDLIFFKGRNIRSKALGHVSIVYSVDSSGIQLIHATQRGVVIDRLSQSAYYKARLLFYARPKQELSLNSEN